MSSLATHTLYSPSGRWLYNDAEQRAARYTPFGVDALQEIACKSVDARRCTAFTKIAEGSYNKIFLLEFDNTSRAVARIPSSIVGNTHLSTCSEVATMQFVREELDSHYAPKVLAWNASSSNPVALPFILMEYLPNPPLQSCWYHIKGVQTGYAMSDICWLQYFFTLRKFSQIGSLYFKEDVSPELQDRPLYLSDEDNQRLSAQKYRIGPIVDREWWRGERRNMRADRGPWPDMASYITAAARLAQESLSRGVETASSSTRSSLQDLPEIHQLLEKCIAAAPHLAPPDSTLLSPLLAHPDMSASNMLIESPEKPSITCFLDWQGAIVAPVFMQASIPALLAYTDGVFELDSEGYVPPLPEDIDQCPSDEQEYLRLHHKLLSRYRFYLAQLPKLVPIHAAAWRYPHQEVTSDLPLYVLRCWADGPLRLRDALMKISDPDSSTVPCAIDFPPGEREAHDEELRARVRYQATVEKLVEYVGCDGQGWVEEERFQEARRAVEGAAGQWDDAVGPFPFRDGSWSFFLN
ncbi:kinase-like domain-containing protein [Armillaria nabsnona]|nr:kinase-like domain-containing protein [Armillaria nabsnona]